MFKLKYDEHEETREDQIDLQCVCAGLFLIILFFVFIIFHFYLHLIDRGALSSSLYSYLLTKWFPNSSNIQLKEQINV